MNSNGDGFDDDLSDLASDEKGRRKRKNETTKRETLDALII